MKPLFILGIESSCDDTSVSILKNQEPLVNITANQEVHKEYGGVVPELASRAHQENIIPTISSAIKKANISFEKLNAIAFTNGPGLIGSLLVGNSVAKSLSMGFGLPLIEVNHMQAHILAHFIETGKKQPEFPFLCLTVSGGHTQIVLVEDYFKMTVLGETLDDAAGEAFDKSAKILGLNYPGGPLIDKLSKYGNGDTFSFAKPKVSNLNFSFSGLKTSILYFVEKQRKINPNFVAENLEDLCASIQKTIISILLEKIDRAVAVTGIKQIAIAGGVSANSSLRETLLQQEKLKNWEVFIPEFEYTTDNAAMIAVTGYFKYLNNEFCSYKTVPKAKYTF